MYQKYSKNTDGCDYVVGDIHGCFTLLQRALASIGFNPEVDRLFSAGDLVDRGPENEAVLDWLLTPWFFPVRGNHDEFVINHAEIGDMRGVHLYNGGAWFLTKDAGEQNRFIYAMRNLPIAIEVETDEGSVGIVHAEVPNDDWPWFRDKLLHRDYQADHIDHCAMWSRSRITSGKGGNIMPDVKGIDMVCVGHTVVKEAINIANVLYLDTGAVRTGKFTFACIQGEHSGKILEYQHKEENGEPATSGSVSTT